MSDIPFVAYPYEWYRFLLERIGKENGEESDAASSHDEALWQKAPVRRRRVEKPKKKKDPNAPKGPGNVFFLYCRFERDKIKDQYPNESLGDITKILAQKWKDLPKDEKQVSAEICLAIYSYHLINYQTK